MGMGFTRQALASELTTDPLGYGYAGFVASGFDAMLAEMLNHIRDGSTAPPAGATGAAISVKRKDISPSEVFQAIELGDLATSLSAAQVGWLQSLFMAPYPIQLLDDAGTNTPVRTNVLSVLKAGASGSKSRLAALETRNGSRAEQLFGPGAYINSADIAKALRG